MILQLLSPVAMSLVGAVIALLALVLHRRVVLVFGLVLMFVAVSMMTPLGANALVGLIERQAAPRDRECESIEAIVLLSGGLKRAPRHREDFDALTRRSLARGFDLVERLPGGGLPVVVSGGGGFAIREADVLSALLERLGHGHPTLLLERDSRTTWENARGTRTLLPDVQRIALATSALHLPRARRVFEAAGFAVCPWPLDPQYVRARGIGALWPQSSSLLKAERAMHELIGEAYYRFRSRMPGRFTPGLSIEDELDDAG